MYGFWRSGLRAAVAMRVLVCGYYGEHNLGDDALLQVVLQQLPKGCCPLVTAHDTAQVEREHGVACVDRRRLGQVLAALGRCQALVLGGGSLLQDATSFTSLVYYVILISAARLQGKTVLLWGQGLGPLRRRRSRLLVRQILPWVSGCSWRDPDSAALARRWGVTGEVGSDPVWGTSPRRWQGSGGPIVLCWRPVHQLQGTAWQPYLQAVEALAVRTDREVLWLPFHQVQDRGLLAHLQQQGLVGEELARRSREVGVNTPDEAMELFSRAGLVLAMRLHGLILAALAGSPLAALSYDPKVAAAARGLGCRCQDLGEPPTQLLDSWLQQLDQPLPAAAVEHEQQGCRVHRHLLQRLGAQDSETT